MGETVIINSITNHSAYANFLVHRQSIFAGSRYLSRGNKRANTNVENNCLSTTYNGKMTHQKIAKIMIGDITLEVRRQWQNAAKVYHHS